MGWMSFLSGWIAKEACLAIVTTLNEETAGSFGPGQIFVSLQRSWRARVRARRFQAARRISRTTGTMKLVSLV